MYAISPKAYGFINICRYGGVAKLESAYWLSAYARSVYVFLYFPNWIFFIPYTILTNLRYSEFN